MKKILIVLLIAGLLCACANSPKNTFQFNSATTRVVDTSGSLETWYPYSTFEELEAIARTPSEELYPGSDVIIVCGEVIGESVNRIIEPSDFLQRDPNKVYGSNHVVTPFKIKNVIASAGSNANVKEGDIIYVLEQYFFVTEETPAYLEYYPSGTIIAYNSNPMEIGKTYILYSTRDTDPEQSMYWYNNQPLHGTGKMSLYCISDNEPKQFGSPLPHYEEIWEKVKAAYGYLAQQG